MHVKCSHLDGSSDPYDNFSSHRCTSQFYSPNGTYESHRPTLATSTLTELHPLAYTAPLPKNSKESSTIEPVTTQDLWSNHSPDFIEFIMKIYSKVVHWKPVFMILSKNKVGYNFIETLNRTLYSLIENNENSFAMPTAMDFPRLVLCKTKFENDGYLSKTIARRLKK